jgi:hypothetical protein
MTTQEIFDQEIVSKLWPYLSEEIRIILTLPDPPPDAVAAVAGGIAAHLLVQMLPTLGAATGQAARAGVAPTPTPVVHHPISLCDALKLSIAELDRVIAGLTRALASTSDPARRAALEAEIAADEQQRLHIEGALPWACHNTTPPLPR